MNERPEKPAPASPQALLEARRISKRFPGVQALDQVDFAVRRGELCALLGENGAGKSTLMNILSGVFPPDSGVILMKGSPVKFQNTRDAQAAGIATIFQELSLFPQLTVAENIFLGREPLQWLGMIDYRKIHRETRRLLGELECDIRPQTPVGQLRVGQQQIVEIARALTLKSRLIIMDEPTSAITDQETRVLFRLIANLKRSGTGIAYITHKLDELFQIADRVTVFRDGRHIDTRSLADLNRRKMIRMMVGRELAEHAPEPRADTGNEAFRVRSLSLKNPKIKNGYIIRDIDFAVRKGEVLGVFGLMGSGRTEMLEAIFGLHPGLTEGTLSLKGTSLRVTSPRHAIRSGIGLVPEDRKHQGLILQMTVGANASLSTLPRCERFGFISPSKESRHVGRFVQRLQIKTASLQQRILNLSGGNQQKIVLAKWLATDPAVLLLDEPTRGIDVNAKQEIYRLINELARTGLAVVMVSSELPEVLAISDRVMVLCEGRKAGEFTRNQFQEETVMEAALSR